MVILDYRFLPNDITTEIFTRLPMKSVLRCRLVCKTWCLVIDKARYDATMQFPQAKGNTKFTFIIVNSDRDGLNCFLDLKQQRRPRITKIEWHGPINCRGRSLIRKSYVNGLFCLSSFNLYNQYFDFEMHIYNPATQESVRLPKFNPPPVAMLDYVLPGFGFDKSSKQYKVVQLFCSSTHRLNTEANCINTEAQVLTLDNSNLWRRLENVPKVEIRSSSPALVNGILQWLTNGKHILSFDLASESFGVIAYPPLLSTVRPSDKIRLINLSGCLSIVDYYDFHFNLWIMKDYNVHGSWTKFCISMTMCSYNAQWHKVVHPICLWKTNQILLLCKSKILVSYNLNSGVYTTILDISRIWDYKYNRASLSYEIYPYDENLISFKSVCKEARSKSMQDSQQILFAMLKKWVRERS